MHQFVRLSVSRIEGDIAQQSQGFVKWRTKKIKKSQFARSPCPKAWHREIIYLCVGPAPS